MISSAASCWRGSSDISSGIREDAGVLPLPSSIGVSRDLIVAEYSRRRSSFRQMFVVIR